MGIKNLNSFLTKYSPNSIQEVDISTLDGYTIAIDTSIFLYKFMYSLKFIDNFLQQVWHLRKNNIQPIYVFDGAPPKEKQETLNNRKEQKEKLFQRMDEIKEQIKIKRKEKEDIKELQKEYDNVKRKCINITREDIMNLKNVFDILGVRYIQADCEADLVCCYMYKEGLVNACMSNDMDFLPSGCGKLVRNYNLSNTVFVYDLESILTTIGLNYNEFVDFCILCGCDYTGKIPRLGSISAYNYIKSDKNIESIMEKYCGDNKKYVNPINFEYETSRKILKNEEKNIKINIKNNEITKKKLIDIPSTQISYIKSMTRYKDKKFNNLIELICEV
jgi:flap endonuclease-1